MGRYGQALVIGTLLGSKKARLKEIGATSYNCYGMLKNRTESDLRLLIRQMVQMGYIVQTDGEYSVLKVGNIEELQRKNAQIMVKKFKEKKKFQLLKTVKIHMPTLIYLLFLRLSASPDCRLQKKNPYHLTLFLQTKPSLICAKSCHTMKKKCWMFPVLDRTN